MAAAAAPAPASSAPAATLVLLLLELLLGLRELVGEARHVELQLACIVWVLGWRALTSVLRGRPSLACRSLCAIRAPAFEVAQPFPQCFRPSGVRSIYLRPDHRRAA